jgi:PAS domain S-box-containing protein
MPVSLELELASLAIAVAAGAAAWWRWGQPRWCSLRRAVGGLLDLGRDSPAVLASVERSARVEGTVQSIQHSTALLVGKLRAQADADHSVARVEGAADGRLEWTSSALARWTGRTPSELQGHGWISSIHPEDREQVADEWSRCIRFGRTFDAAFRLRDDDGVAIWVRMTASPVPVPELPEVACWVGALRQTGSPPLSAGLGLPERAA